MERKHIAVGFLLIASFATFLAGCKKSNNQSTVNSSSIIGKNGVDQVDVIDVGGSSESGVIVDFNTGAVVGTKGEKPSGSSSKNSGNSSKATDNKSQTSSETSDTSNTSSNVSSSDAPSEASDVSEPTTMDGNTPWE